MEPEVVTEVAKLPDTLTRVREAGAAITRLQVAITELSRLRREGLEQLVSQGMTHTQIAEQLGTTRARIGQLLTSGPSPERALLGPAPGGGLIVALGGKVEGGKEAGAAGPVVAQEDLQAYDRLRKLAQTLGLSTRYEVVSQSGMIDLTRDGLIVICGPRLSPLIAQVLAGDRRLAFERDDSGWHLVDRVTGRVYHSPMDADEPGDYAYLGRLPRLDGQGSFLYIAGIHAAGAAGVVHYLSNHLRDLYDEVKRKRFSLLVGCTFDPDTREVTSSAALTPVYRHEGA